MTSLTLIDTADTEKMGPGNTSKVRSRYWFFTLNNYVLDDIHIVKNVLDTETQEFAFQEEKGEEGTPHLQGCFKFKNARYFDSVKRLFPRAHLERCKRWKDALKYCTKVDTRIGKTYTNIKDLYIPKEIKDIFLNYTPYNYQKDILNIIKSEPDDRSIYWFWEEKGGTGKSTFTKHLVLKHGAIVISGKAADMKNAILQMKNKPELIIIDIPRSMLNYISYAGIEEIKNGCFFSGKYEGGMCVFNNPHIICFANDEPNIDEMSHDRWKITKIIL